MTDAGWIGSYPGQVSCVAGLFGTEQCNVASSPKTLPLSSNNSPEEGGRTSATIRVNTPKSYCFRIFQIRSGIYTVFLS